MASAPEPVTDLYGFQTKATIQQQAIRQMADGVSRLNEATWLPFVQQNKLPPENKLKDLVRTGVPPTLRSWVWMEVSGAAAKKAAVGNNYFNNMALAGEKSQWLGDINKDICHTFPNHPWLQEHDGQAALRRVLAAYSVHNEQVGYCRSMNQIVALLLVALNRNQETAFWLLAALVEDILAPGTYDPHLIGCQVEMKALDELITQKMPRLAAHMAAVEADISILATDWYLTLFATSMPPETVTRVWDGLFNEGPKVLFRTALALLKSQEATLLKFDNAGELLMAVRQHASSMHDRDALMDTAFDGVGSLPMAAIERYREQRSAEVKAIVRERQAMKNRQLLQQTLSNKQNAVSEGPEVSSQLEGLTLNAQLREAGKQAEVLGKQAASNIKKGFGAFMQGAKELSAKAQAEISKHNHKLGHSNEGAGHAGDAGAVEATGNRHLDRPAQHLQVATAAAQGTGEDELL